MNNNGEQDLYELIRMVRQNLATPEILAELHALISTDPALLRTYIREMHFQSSLHWLLDGGVPGDAALRTQLRQYHRARRRVWLWRGTTIIVAATVLFSLGTVASYRLNIHDLEIAPVVAQIEAAHNARRLDERATHHGVLLREGDEFGLQTGIAQLLFASGARVSLQGQARLRIAGPNQISALAGNLVADVPPPAAGFTVLAGNVTAVDLGTRFGVILSPDGAAEFHVLEGQVQASSRSLPIEVLGADEASRYSSDGRERQAIPASGRPFTPIFRFAAGIADLTGNARFDPHPLKSVRADASLPPGVMHLLLESRQFRLPADLAILSVAEGQIGSGASPARAMLAAGTEVDAYFVQYASGGVGDGMCQITFRRPVLGVVVEPAALNQTDRLFGIAGLNYLPADCDPQVRGALVPAGGKQEAGDSLALSEDRRTLTLSLNAGPTFIDQLRILVQPESFDASAAAD